MPTARALLIELTIVAGLGLFLALIGPFGSFEAPLADRLVYWLGLGVGGLLVFRPAMTGASGLARRLDLPEAAMWTAAGLIAAVPMTIVVWLVTPGGPAAWPSSSDWLERYASVAVIGAGVTLVFWFVSAAERRAAAAPTVAEAPPATTEEPRFLDRLPKHLGRDLLALEMEDHYVRAHTAAGSALILLRMRDAVAELDGIDGLQVHRSWWVARAAVERVVQDGRNMRLGLRNGIEAPVARSTQPALRAAGWLPA